MFVKCIDTKIGLTIGKVYEVLGKNTEGDEERYIVINDDGNKAKVFTRRFQIINEPYEKPKKSAGIWKHHKRSDCIVS